MFRYILIFAAVLLTGCTSSNVKKYEHYPKTTDWQTIDPKETQYYKEVRGNADGQPNIGLALSGGGQRSAAVSMGFLEALQESAILPQVDSVSSVSGGSYAAYWWYSHHYWAAKESELGRKDELKTLNIDLYNRFYLWDICGEISKYLATTAQTPSQDVTDNCAATPMPPEYKSELNYYQKFRFFIHDRNRGYLLTRSQKPFESYQVPFAERLDKTLRTIELGVKAALWLPVLPLHWVANGVFDSKSNLNLMQNYYQNGIEREYGLYPICRVEEGSQDCTKLKSYANDKYILNLKAHDPLIPQLNDEMRKQQLPFWIINTTAAYSQHMWPKMLRGFPRAGYSQSLYDTVYEFTPVSQGSARFGYCAEYQVDCALSRPIKLSRRVAISGAAIDAVSPGKNTALDIFNLSLGQYIANPNIPDSTRTWRQFIPAPFVWFIKNSHEEQSPHVYLSDGGHSDNLGLYSLIRRGTKQIIVLDAEHESAKDKSGKYAVFEALRRDRCLLLDEKRAQIDIEALDLRNNNDCDGNSEFKAAPIDLKSNGESTNKALFEGFVCRIVDQKSLVAPKASNLPPSRTPLTISEPCTAHSPNLMAQIIYVKLSADYDDINNQERLKACREGKMNDSGRYSCDTRYYGHKHKDEKYPQVSTADISFDPDQHSGYVAIGYDLGRQLDIDHSSGKVFIK